jgi:hypothetical protein
VNGASRGIGEAIISMDIRKRIDAIFRPHPVKKEKLLAGMTQWEKELDEQFRANARRRALVRKLARDLRPKEIDAAIEKERRKACEKARAALRKLPPPKPLAVKVPKHEDRIIIGSLGATYGPPYDVQWTWSETQGDPPSPQVSADANTGTLSLTAQTLDDGSAVAARAAVGNWLTGGNGPTTVNISAAPAISWDWLVDVVANWGESAGWLGFLVQSFDRHTGNFIDTVLSQQISLWDTQISANSWPVPGWIQSQSNQGSSSGYPMQGQFTSLGGLFYTIWIWFGVYAAEGDDVVAQFPQITVPFFSWQSG